MVPGPGDLGGPGGDLGGPEVVDVAGDPGLELSPPPGDLGGPPPGDFGPGPGDLGDVAGGPGPGEFLAPAPNRFCTTNSRRFSSFTRRLCAATRAGPW